MVSPKRLRDVTLRFTPSRDRKAPPQSARTADPDSRAMRYSIRQLMTQAYRHAA